MSTPFEPMGLNALVNVAMRAELRSLPGTQRTAVAALRRAGITPPELTELVLNDPVLSALLLREVGRQTSSRSSRTLGGINHCLTLLGMERSATLIRMTTSLPAESTDPEELGYREAVITSLHAAAMVGDWQRQLPLLHFEQTYLAALLTRLPEWCLWQQAPKEMKMIETLSGVYGVPRADAERAVLGCTLAEASLRIARDWRLSDILQHGMDIHHMPPMRTLVNWAGRTLRNHAAHIIYRDETVHRVDLAVPLRALIANAIAVEARHGWYSKVMRRMVRLLAAYMEVSEEAAWARIRNTVLEMARQVPDNITAQRAASLLWNARPAPRRKIPPALLAEAVQRLYNNQGVKAAPARPLPPARDKTLPASPIQTARPVAATPQAAAPAPAAATAPPTAKTVSEAVAPAKPPAQQTAPDKSAAELHPGMRSPERQRMFEQHIARLQGNGATFRVEHEVVRTGADILRECSRMERIVVALVHQSRDNIASYYAVGCEKAPGLRRFEIKLQPPTLFTQMTRQPAAIWISPTRQREVLDLLPPHFREASAVDNCFAASLFNAKGAFAILYADKGISYGTLEEADYQVFRTLVNATNRYLASHKG